MDIAPCKDCDSSVRHLGCHDRCLEYKRWSDKRNAVKETIKKERLLNKPRRYQR